MLNKSYYVFLLGSLLVCSACSMLIDVEAEQISVNDDAEDQDLSGSDQMPNDDSDALMPEPKDQSISDDMLVEPADSGPAVDDMFAEVDSEVIPNLDMGPDILDMESDSLDMGLDMEIDALDSSVPEPDIDWEALDEEISALLPAERCIMEYNGSCIQQLNEDLSSTCSNWDSYLHRNTPFPWSGTQETCDLGTYNENGTAEFQAALNYRRSLLKLEPTTVSLSDEMRDCALATDIELLNNEPFNMGSICYSEERFAAYSASYKMRVSGAFSLYQHLHQTLDIRTNDVPLAGLLPQRHFLLAQEARALSTGERGVSACIRIDDSQLESELWPAVLYPGVGVLPFEVVAPEGNRSSEQVWSLTWSNQVITEVSVDLSRFEGALWTPVTIDTELVSVYEPLVQSILAIKPLDTITAHGLYRLEVSWIYEGQPQQLRYYNYYADCELAQPSECNPLSDDCQQLGRRCVLDRFNRSRTYCAWPGPNTLGAPCTYGEPLSCQEGECAPDVNQEARCMNYCSLNETEGNNRCDSSCESSTVELTEDLALCY